MVLSLPIDVVRDAEFRNLGFLFDELEDKLVFVEAQRFVSAARETIGTSCVLCTPELEAYFPDVEGLATTREPRLMFFQIQRHLVQETDFYWTRFGSEVHSSARIHPRAYIAELNVRIGPNTMIDANAVVAERTLIGAGVHVRAGAVIGSEGFQSARDYSGVVQMLHGGGVEVGDNVEIFANAVIAAGVFRQMTSLGEGSQVGNGAFVSHNVRLGKRCFVGHNSTINGNTTIEDDVWIGPGATVSDRLHIGARAQISIGAVVIRSVPTDTRVTGMTALEHRRMLRHLASIGQK